MSLVLNAIYNMMKAEVDIYFLRNKYQKFECLKSLGTVNKEDACLVCRRITLLPKNSKV